MNISELNKKYTKGELSSTEGDKQLRYEALSPLFKNLYENKVIYHERVTSIIRLENIILTPDLFEATAIRLKLFEPISKRFDRIASSNSWTIGANWAYLTLDKKGCLHPYSGWLMWIDPELVRKVEKMVNDNNFEEARNLTIDL
ncbi:MAG: hypothetical protein ACOYMF_04615 [Bacteroidales bacterium]